MRLSTKGRYAVTAMMDIALHQKQGPVTLAEISQCQGISLSYLEQLFAKLRKEGLVKGVRGPGGGYSLAKSPDQISVADIIQSVDEKLDMTKCGGKGNCSNGDKCLSHQLWFDLSCKLYKFLNGIKLDQYVNRPEINELVIKQDAQYGRFLNRSSVVA
ncbi:MAG: Fe-S cluster assembly transcriptional regulator IscR [Gammaproteobacteria bacterium]|jgi:Rrf2 family iron-sulfur cluster assembly transcriptional regulator|nr:MAG: Fe-S cluster assembly transcriptional regulator IscR [Gammaproteobacteria bacterium]